VRCRWTSTSVPGTQSEINLQFEMGRLRDELLKLNVVYVCRGSQKGSDCVEWWFEVPRSNIEIDDDADEQPVRVQRA
jgi:hypothetical protein